MTSLNFLMVYNLSVSLGKLSIESQNYLRSDINNLAAAQSYFLPNNIHTPSITCSTTIGGLGNPLTSPNAL